MLAKFLLQRSHQLTQRLLLVRHHLRQQQAVQHPIPLRQMPADAHATRLFAADQNVFRQHQVAHILKADAMLMQLAAVFRRDPVQHQRRVERTRHVARPPLALKQPLQQNRKDLVRIHHVAVLIDRTDAVRIPVRHQPRNATFFDHPLLRLADMRHDRLGVDPRECRVDLRPHLHVRHPSPGKNPRDHPSPSPVHAVDQEPVPRRLNCR